MLTEVPRQVLHLLPEPDELPHPLIVSRETDIGELARQRVVRIHVLELVHHLREAIDVHLVELERLSHFAGGTSAAIGDDVGGHRCPVRAVLLVDVLDHPLAPIAARQIQIDVGPLTALLGEEALEEQLHADRIHGRDAQAVADGAIGRRATPLHQDVLLPAEVHDVPDDEEVAGELELLDEIQLAGDLGARAIVVGAIAMARPQLGDLPEKGDLGLTRRHGIAGKPVAEILHRELQAIRQIQRGVQGVGQVGEEPCHLDGRLEIALGIEREPTPGLPERHVLANRGEHVEERPLFGRGEPHAAGGHDRDAEGAGQGDEHVVVVLLLAPQVPLHLDVDIRPPEDAHQRVEQPADAVTLGPEQGLPRQRDQAADVPVEIGQRERALAFRRAQLHSGNQAAQVLPALFGGDKDGKDTSGDFLMW